MTHISNSEEITGKVIAIRCNPPIMFDGKEKKELLEEARSEYEEQMEVGEFQCKAEDCQSDSFDVNLHVASKSRYEGTAICRDCNNRHELSLPVKGLDEQLEDVESEIRDVFEG